MKSGNREIVEKYLRCYNEKNTNAMLELFSDDVRFESVSNTGGVVRTENKQQLRELASQTVEWFEERRQTASGWVESGDDVAVEIDFRCRLAMDFPDGKKAGQEMSLRGASFFTIRDGLIRRLTDYM